MCIAFIHLYIIVFIFACYIVHVHVSQATVVSSMSVNTYKLLYTTVTV